MPAVEPDLLRGLRVLSAGFLANSKAPARRERMPPASAMILYCAGGGGWCEVDRQIHRIQPGDLCLLPAGVPRAYGCHASRSWSCDWVEADGDLLPAYFEALGARRACPVISLGEHIQLRMLFGEIRRNLAPGANEWGRIHAAQTLGYLLSTALQSRHCGGRLTSDGVHRVARGIVYMSEHLNQPLKISALAAQAGLSPAHFAVLFKEQAGSTPRDYLHLLRMHRACELLAQPTLSLKEIAAQLGYQDQFHFSRKFKAYSGLPPSQYRAPRSFPRR